MMMTSNSPSTLEKTSLTRKVVRSAKPLRLAFAFAAAIEFGLMSTPTTSFEMA